MSRDLGGRYLENLLNVITSPNMVRLHQIWYADTSCLHNLRNVSKSKPEVNSTWRRWPYWISVLSQYLGRRSSAFDQIWCADADFDPALENLSKI